MFVRKLFLFVCTFLALAVALAYAEQLSATADGVRAAVRHITLPFKLAMLYVKEPDRELAMPVEGVRAKQVKDTWKASRSGGRLHEGQDIFAKRGTAVYAATHGYVTRIGESPLGGKTVFVLGRGGRSYYYAHLDAYASGLTVSDYVTPQTLLGFVGTTGNAAGTSPHLHFGIYTRGSVIDPLPLLRDRS